MGILYGKVCCRGPVSPPVSLSLRQSFLEHLELELEHHHFLCKCLLCLRERLLNDFWISLSLLN